MVANYEFEPGCECGDAEYDYKCQDCRIDICHNEDSWENKKDYGYICRGCAIKRGVIW